MRKRDPALSFKATDATMGFRERHAIPDLGVGVGFRKPHVVQVLRDRPAMDWFEVTSENYFAEGGIQRRNLEELRAAYRVVPHGLSLSIGGAEPLDEHSAELSTETRVAVTDAPARAKFRRYWAAFSAGIRLLRFMVLRNAKRKAERQPG